MDRLAKLSDNFLFYEAVQSSTASRLGIDNVPTDETIINAIKYHAQTVVQPIRDNYRSFSPNSWYRSPELEKAICASSYAAWCAKRNMHLCEASWQLYLSRKSHPRGEATDIRIPGVSNVALFNWIKDESGIEYDQLILEFVPKHNPFEGWVHVSSFDESTGRKNRMQAFNIN